MLGLHIHQIFSQLKQNNKLKKTFLNWIARNEKSRRNIFCQKRFPKTINNNSKQRKKRTNSLNQNVKFGKQELMILLYSSKKSLFQTTWISIWTKKLASVESVFKKFLFASDSPSQFQKIFAQKSSTLLERKTLLII